MSGIQTEAREQALFEVDLGSERNRLQESDEAHVL